MPRFFVNTPPTDTAIIVGDDAVHIAKSLRMRVGERLTLCDESGFDYACEITEVSPAQVALSVLEKIPTTSEPTVRVTLYQGLPKSDKMDWIVQKAVELGVDEIVPVATARSIVKLDAKDGQRKQTRWQRISDEAAGQSGRGKRPTVLAPLSMAEAEARMKNEHTLVFYEGGGQPVSDLVNTQTQAVSIVVGPEGGFAPEEVDRLCKNGAICATLGPRILRCETAPVAALAVVMALTDNMD